jgi:hypothetical protein
VTAASCSIPSAVGETPLDERKLGEERARYFREAHAAAQALRARAAASPPTWNPTTGRADLDQLLWFRYVNTDGRPE